MHLRFTSRPFDKVPARCAVVTLFSDVRPLMGNGALLDWRMNGRLSRLLKSSRFEGQPGELLLMPSEGRIRAEKILAVGLGTRGSFVGTRLSDLIPLLLDVLSHSKTSDFLLSLSDIIDDRFEWRNGVRLLVSKLHDYSSLSSVTLCEMEDCVKDAKRRHMDFGYSVDVSFESFAA